MTYDLTGMKFGKLTAKEITGLKNKYNERLWRCICDCGNEMLVATWSLRSGRVKSCGCSRIKENLTGMRFGALTITGRSEPDEYGKTNWICQCDCGKIRLADTYHLQIGKVKSCGCLNKKEGEVAFNKVLGRYKNNARSKGVEFSLSKDRFRTVVTSKCTYCGIELSQTEEHLNGNFKYNGIDRIDNSKGYIEGNVTGCCKRCNFIKGTHSKEDFFSLVKKILENLEKK